MVFGAFAAPSPLKVAGTVPGTQFPLWEGASHGRRPLRRANIQGLPRPNASNCDVLRRYSRRARPSRKTAPARRYSRFSFFRR
ncbi:MAG: hypothetical protein OXU61_02370 [Gammaproteobacteria bacterium]|nr:hypothetical protein [Gammaproteobacteria bacterium]